MDVTKNVTIRREDLRSCLNKRVHDAQKELTLPQERELSDLLFNVLSQTDGTIVKISERSVEFLLAGLTCGIFEEIYRSGVVRQPKNKEELILWFREIFTACERLTDESMCSLMRLLLHQTGEDLKFDAMPGICSCSIRCIHRAHRKNLSYCTYSQRGNTFDRTVGEIQNRLLFLS